MIYASTCSQSDASQAPQHPGGEEHREGHHHFSGHYDLFCKKSVFPSTLELYDRAYHLFQVISAMQARFRLEEFAEADLLVNITHHKLVPRHEILDPEQKKLLLER